ncbi:MAG: acyl-CoA dehydrogenase family protein [Dehalococcoidia bacterium]|nr:acyl-CoA dehydrogenase family protein [Dehalococcoidia bacterium]MDW8119734.1 acyl-CoA dehydrogenase family protein [Chloroflexota bacterium]
MDFRFTPQQEAFRQEIRSWLAQELTPEMRQQYVAAGGEGFSREFSRKLGQKGWIGLAWPKEYGGQALGYIERTIYLEEMLLAAAPIAYHHFADRQMGPSIMMFGTEEQKRFFLPRIVRGECGFCIGYSEPSSGSDLASVQTRAVQDGDDYIINGSKIWTSYAHLQDYIWLATRTNPDAPKHRGISVFIVDMKTPGVTVRPIINMAGVHSFNQVFFDNVRVPKTAMVGEKDRGWYVVASNLDFERSGIERIAQYRPLWEQVLAFAREQKVNGKPLTSDPRIRNRLAEIEVEYQVGRWLAYYTAWVQSRGIVPNKEASIIKVFGAEWNQRMLQTAMEVLGLYGQLTTQSKWAPLAGRVQRAWLAGFSVSIAGGTNEVQRNIIALRGLGLPRG